MKFDVEKYKLYIGTGLNVKEFENNLKDDLTRVYP